MPKKRKYARFSDEPSSYECCNRKCKWQGTDIEKGIKQVSSYEKELVCPKCGKNEFYGLL